MKWEIIKITFTLTYYLLADYLICIILKKVKSKIYDLKYF